MKLYARVYGTNRAPYNLIPRVLSLPQGRERTLGTRLGSVVDTSFPSEQSLLLCHAIVTIYLS